MTRLRKLENDLHVILWSEGEHEKGLIDTRQAAQLAVEFLQNKAADLWAEGNKETVEFILKFVENEPDELAGYIDQHFVGVSAMQMANPYVAVEEVPEVPQLQPLDPPAEEEPQTDTTPF